MIVGVVNVNLFCFNQAYGRVLMEHFWNSFVFVLCDIKLFSIMVILLQSSFISWKFDILEKKKKNWLSEIFHQKNIFKKNLSLIIF